MAKMVRNHVTDLRGVSRMLVDAICGSTGLVEAMHANIARQPARLAGATVGRVLNGIPRGVSGLSTAPRAAL